MTLTGQLARLHTDAQNLVRLVDAVCECADSTIAALHADLNDALMRVSRLADERDTWSWLYAERSWIATQLMDYTPQLEWLLAEARDELADRNETHQGDILTGWETAFAAIREKLADWNPDMLLPRHSFERLLDDVEADHG